MMDSITHTFPPLLPSPPPNTGLDDQSIPELWYSPEYPYEAMLQAWDTILGDVKHHWNLFAIGK